MFNIWAWLIQGFLVIVATTMVNLLPPATTQQSLDNAQSFAWFFSTGAWTIFSLCWSALSIFNWVIMVPALAYNLLLWFIRVGLSVWFFLKRIFLVD